MRVNGVVKAGAALAAALFFGFTLTSLGGSSSLGAPEEARVLAAVHVTDADPNPSRTYSSPVMARDPRDPDRIVAAVAEIRSRTCNLLRSRDAGRSWEDPDTNPVAEGYPFCFQTETGPTQAVTAFGGDGTLYYAYAGWDIQDTQSEWPIGPGGGWRGNVTPVLARSADFGDSWETTVIRDARGLPGEEQENNRPVSSLVVDSTSGSRDIVYVGWKVTYRDGRQLPLVASSSDGGVTFSEPMDLTAGYFEDDDNRRRLAEAADLDDVPPASELLYYWPDLTLDREGTLYAVWNVRFGPGPQMDDTAAFLSTSRDGGRTFTVVELSPATETYRYPALQWSPVGGPQGTLHLVYETETPQGIQWVNDIYHERSTDGGVTWNEATRLSDDPADALVGQYHPDLIVAPHGRVDVAWWDFRNDATVGGFINDVYLASSSDNGDTWSENIRVTDRSIERRSGVWYGNADIRQPPGLVATDAYTVIGWDDTRGEVATTEGQDVYSAAVQFETLEAGTSSLVRVALGVAAGVAVFGAFLLVAAMSRRGRSR